MKVFSYASSRTSRQGSKEAPYFSRRCKEFCGEGIGLQFAAGAWGIFLNPAILTAETGKVSLLVHLRLIAGRVQSQPLPTMEQIMSKLVGNGKGALLN
jgi:hypothetical protein